MDIWDTLYAGVKHLSYGMNTGYRFLLTSSIFILAIILIRAVFQNKMSVRLQYALWLLVAVKLLVPSLQMESSISMQKLIEPLEHTLQRYIYGAASEGEQHGSGTAQWKASEGAQHNRGGNQWETSERVQYDRDGNQWETLDEERAKKRTARQNTAADKMRSDRRAVFGAAGSVLNQKNVWMTWLAVRAAGSAIVFLYFLLGNLRFAEDLRRRRVRFLGCSCPLRVYLVEGLPSPCLYGRAVYIIPDLTADEKRLSHVLAHEYCHYRQGDLLWSMLRCLCLILYWWNPLVWTAAYLSKQDCELACDELAVALLGPKERISYGRTLVSLIPVKTEAGQHLHSMFITATMTGGGRNMKQRIQRIACNQKTVLSVCILVIFLTSICFVSASTVKPEEEEQNKNFSENISADEAVNQGLSSNENVNQDFSSNENVNQGLSSDESDEDRNENILKDEDKEGGEKAVFDLDEAVGQAILSYSEDKYWTRECIAEGHKILDCVQGKKGVTKVYALTMYGEFAFHDGYFIKDSGTGIIPAVIKFSYDETQGYVLKDYKKPMDGSAYMKSIQEMFPQELWDSCHSYSEEQIAELTKMEQAYAKKYLKKIGRKAPVGHYSDSEHPLLTDAGVSVEVSNKMCDLEKYQIFKYPDWIGNLEEIEDGVRYVYEMALDKKAGEIIYTKSVYDTGRIVEQFRFDMYTGEEK